MWLTIPVPEKWITKFWCYTTNKRVTWEKAYFIFLIGWTDIKLYSEVPLMPHTHTTAKNIFYFCLLSMWGFKCLNMLRAQRKFVSTSWCTLMSFVQWSSSLCASGKLSIASWVISVSEASPSIWPLTSRVVLQHYSSPPTSSLSDINAGILTWISAKQKTEQRLIPG